MTGLKLIATIFLCSFVASASAAIHPDVDWATHAQLEEFHVMWTKNDPDWMTMEISAPTTGYVAIGFTERGGMKGADIVMGWVDDNGTPHLKDLYAIGNSVPLEDTVNNYELLGGEQDGKYTTIRFRRKWATCDESHDYKITEDTMKLIWAYGTDDPDDVTPLNPAYHGTRRGAKYVLLKKDSNRIAFPDGGDDSVKLPNALDFTMNKLVVPAAETAYICQMMKFPEFKTKTQITGWRPLIEKSNFKRVHHILFYECYVPEGEDSAAVFEQHVGKTVPCYTENMPAEWSYCWTVPIAFTLGVEGEMLADHVGLPMGEQHGGANYFMLEMHYDNQEVPPPEFVDSSGIRVYTTENVRQYDMGVFWVGNRFSAFHFIPPQQKAFTTFGGCTPECTSKALPPGGIHISHVQLHGHAFCTKFSVKHSRNGVELPPLAEDNNYDNDYQQARALNPPVNFLPGDSMMSVCEYDTSNRDKPVYGGITTEGSEMCVAFVSYYPKIALTSCQWQTEFQAFLNAVGVRRVDGQVLKTLQLPYKPTRRQKYDLPDEIVILVSKSMAMNPFEQMTVKDWGKNRGKTVTQVIDGLPWTKPNKLVREMKPKLENASNYAFCTGQGRTRIPLRKYIVQPEKLIPFVKPKEVCIP